MITMRPPDGRCTSERNIVMIVTRRTVGLYLTYSQSQIEMPPEMWPVGVIVGPAGVVVARLTCNEKVTSSILVWGIMIFFL